MALSFPRSPNGAAAPVFLLRPLLGGAGPFLGLGRMVRAGGSLRRPPLCCLDPEQHPALASPPLRPPLPAAGYSGGLEPPKAAGKMAGAGGGDGGILRLGGPGGALWTGPGAPPWQHLAGGKEPKGDAGAAGPGGRASPRPVGCRAGAGAFGPEGWGRLGRRVPLGPGGGGAGAAGPAAWPAPVSTLGRFAPKAFHRGVGGAARGRRRCKRRHPLFPPGPPFPRGAKAAEPGGDAPPAGGLRPAPLHSRGVASGDTPPGAGGAGKLPGGPGGCVVFSGAGGFFRLGAAGGHYGKPGPFGAAVLGQGG